LTCHGRSIPIQVSWIPRYPPRPAPPHLHPARSPRGRGDLGPGSLPEEGGPAARPAALIALRGERNTARASSPRSSITDPSRASTWSRTMSANLAASLAAASSPRSWVNEVYPRTSAIRNALTSSAASLEAVLCSASPSRVRPDPWEACALGRIRPSIDSRVPGRQTPASLCRLVTDSSLERGA
jgi:hypothetical protein